jgi:hypothetical protein
MDLRERERSQRLTIMAEVVRQVGMRRVKPSVYLRPIAQPHSMSPARKRRSHGLDIDESSHEAGTSRGRKKRG